MRGSGFIWVSCYFFGLYQLQNGAASNKQFVMVVPRALNLWWVERSFVLRKINLLNGVKKYMSNRSLKLKLYEQNPCCCYCGCHTILTDIKSIPSGQSLPPNAATIEHRVSRFSPYRWKKKRKGERRKVISCYECNHDRSVQETLCLSRSEVLKRSQGFSLSPRGRPKIIRPLSTIKEVKKALSA